MSKVVVTGGAGFIGSHLAEGLAGHDHHVVILDDLSTGKEDNISHLVTPSGAEFIRGSVTDAGLLAKLFERAEYVFHLAALPSVPRSVADPISTHEVNATGTLKVLLAARDSGVKKVVYASSSSAYGDTPTLPKSEDMPATPLSPYAVSKLTGEYYCQVFTMVYGLATACLRYFNVYGPRQDPNSQYAAVIPRFIQKISRGEPPVIFGDGQQTRDFTYVRDVVSANMLAAASELTGVFNVGSGNRVTLNELAERLLKLMTSDITPAHDEPRPGDIRHSHADVSRAGQFGYWPGYLLEDGLKETVAWFLERI